MNKKIIIISICTIYLISSLFLVYTSIFANSKEDDIIKPTIINSEGINENLKLDDFYRLKKGMTVAEVNLIVGKPQVPIITGRYLPTYFVVDPFDGISVKIVLDFGINNSLTYVSLSKELLQEKEQINELP